MPDVDVGWHEGWIVERGCVDAERGACIILAEEQIGAAVATELARCVT